MAKVRARNDNGLLFMDFYYQGVRCREQTALPDTADNRRRVQALLNRVEKEIKQGHFDYAATFPNSPRTAKFTAVSEGSQGSRGQSQAPDRAEPVAVESVAAVCATPTFDEFSMVWRAEMAPQWRRLHQRSVDAIFQTHLIPEFGEHALGEITKAQVLTFRARLAERPGRASARLSPASINKIMTILRQCLTEAADRYRLSDVFKGIKRLKARRPDVQPFSLAEVDRIRDHIRSDFRNYVTLRFFTGMRSGEINGLKWKYIDFERRLILVRETYAAGEVEENAKNETSLRDIPMLPMVYEALKEQKLTRHPESEYVFATREGNPIDAHNFANRVWYPLLRFLDLERRRPYQTRHTTATLMLAAGENPEWIARLMGHANTQMLFTVYSRFVPNLTRQDGLAIAGLLSQTEKTSTGALTSEQIDALDPQAMRALLKNMTAGQPHADSSNR